MAARAAMDSRRRASVQTIVQASTLGGPSRTGRPSERGSRTRRRWSLQPGPPWRTWTKSWRILEGRRGWRAVALDP
eukprot:6067403-Lingulodinium_polyedra.AAC.1